MDYKKLIEGAMNASKNAYTPYYKFSVGAGVHCQNNEMYFGCNVENITPAPCCCAEQVAVTNAVKSGNRNIDAIAIYGNGQDYCFPCGSCRQLLVEFNPDMEVIVAKSENDYQIYKASELLPHYFSPKDLKSK